MVWRADFFGIMRAANDVVLCPHIAFHLEQLFYSLFRGGMN